MPSLVTHSKAHPWGWMDGWMDEEEAEMCRGGRMEGGWEQLVVPGPPTPCADSREGKARGRH